MPLAEPPARALLWSLPAVAVEQLWRCHRQNRSPWWFGSADPGPDGGRFDLPAPNGTCYLATAPEGAVLEALQLDFEPGHLLARSALTSRSVTNISMTTDPPVADLTAKQCHGLGVTAALWADSNRPLTKRWAVELHGAGNQAIHHGLQHDTTGSLRGVTFFDRAGDHEPWGLDWVPDTQPADQPTIVDLLQQRGIHVEDPPTALPFLDTPPDD